MKRTRHVALFIVFSILIANSSTWATKALARAGKHSTRQITALIEYGRQGGNIRPFTVSISADGAVTARDARVPATQQHLRKDAVAGLIKLAQAEKFSTLPERISGPGLYPDTASLFITIHSNGVARTVYEHAARNVHFDQLFAVLEAATGITL